MDWEALAGSGANSGLNIAGNIISNTANTMAATRQNERNQANWATQNQWNIDQWNRQNEYNSPQAQMARYKEAGLNPHLIYGTGSASAGNASTVNKSDIKGYSRAEAKSVTQGMDAYGDYARFKNIEAQTDNVKQQENLNKQSAYLKATENSVKSLDLQRDQATYGESIDAIKVNLEQQEHNARKAGIEADVSEGSKQARINMAGQQLRNAEKTGDILKLEKAMKQWDVDMQEIGIQRSDPAWMRGAVKFLKDPKKAMQYIFGKGDSKYPTMPPKNKQ